MKYTNVNNKPTAETLLKHQRSDINVGILYRGKVKDNQDPSGTGRVKVFIPSLYPSISDEDIPWALPCFSTASFNSGSFTIPQVGDNVWVLFENNDIFRPVYIGCMYTTASGQASMIGSSVAPAYENYVPTEGLRPDHYIVNKTPGGSGLWMNDENKTAHFYSGCGGNLDLEEDRVTIAYALGGSISSMEGRVYLVSPTEGYIDIDDNAVGGPSILMRRGEQYISIVEDKKIEIGSGTGEKTYIQVLPGGSIDIVVQGGSGSTVHLDKNNVLVNVGSGSDSYQLHATDKSVQLVETSTNSSVKIADGVITIKASKEITLDAPVVNIP